MRSSNKTKCIKYEKYNEKGTMRSIKEKVIMSIIAVNKISL